MQFPAFVGKVRPVPLSHSNSGPVLPGPLLPRKEREEHCGHSSPLSSTLAGSGALPWAGLNDAFGPNQEPEVWCGGWIRHPCPVDSHAGQFLASPSCPQAEGLAHTSPATPWVGRAGFGCRLKACLIGPMNRAFSARNGLWVAPTQAVAPLGPSLTRHRAGRQRQPPLPRPFPPEEQKGERCGRSSPLASKLGAGALCSGRPNRLALKFLAEIHCR